MYHTMCIAMGIRRYEICGYLDSFVELIISVNNLNTNN